MMWFQRHEEPKIINEDYEQVGESHYYLDSTFNVKDRTLEVLKFSLKYNLNNILQSF